MRYLPKSPVDREEMLTEIGVASIDDLFSTIPAEYRLTRDLNVPRQHGEQEVIEHFKAFAEKNATGYASFLGAGAYRHYRPVMIDTVVSRGEFLTSYTPYQPEIAQGTLQALFEFQTMICELTGMEIANASMYDGSTGVAEAVMMAVRVTGRNGAVVAKTVHPEYREVLATYALHQEIPVTLLDYTANGRVDLAKLDAAITDDTACVLIQSPNFFGTIEDVATIAEVAHKKGALADCSDCRGGVAGDCEASEGSGHCGDGGAGVWRAGGLWRSVLRRNCEQGEVSAADAGTACWRDEGHER